MEELPPKIPAGLQPKPKDVSFDLDLALSSVVSVRTEIPDDAFTAGSPHDSRLNVVHHDARLNRYIFKLARRFQSTVSQQSRMRERSLCKKRRRAPLGNV